MAFSSRERIRAIEALEARQMLALAQRSESLRRRINIFYQRDYAITLSNIAEIDNLCIGQEIEDPTARYINDPHITKYCKKELKERSRLRIRLEEEQRLQQDLLIKGLRTEALCLQTIEKLEQIKFTLKRGHLQAYIRYRAIAIWRAGPLGLGRLAGDGEGCGHGMWRGGDAAHLADLADNTLPKSEGNIDDGSQIKPERDL